MSEHAEMNIELHSAKGRCIIKYDRPIVLSLCSCHGKALSNHSLHFPV